MTSMSHDPAAAVLGAQLVEMSVAAVAAGAAVSPAVSALPPAGAEEISIGASLAFAAMGELELATYGAAQQELARAGAALVDIARMYAQTDATAASVLEANPMEASAAEFAGFTGGSSGRLLRAESLPGAGGTAARTPLMANLVQGAVAATPATPATPAATIPAVATAASTALGAASAPLSSISQFASMGGSMGGAAGGSAAAVPASLTGDEQSAGEEAGAHKTGEELL